MMYRMSVEQADHFLRHIKRHAEELKNGEFVKDETYLEKLECAKEMAVEIAHEIVHIMRRKGFEKYENKDFVFDTKVPETKEELANYTFHEFDYDSFRLACKIQRATEILLWDDEARLDLEPAAAARELENLGNAITDAGVMIELLKDYFNIK